jgi:hypothetical protein
MDGVWGQETLVRDGVKCVGYCGTVIMIYACLHNFTLLCDFMHSKIRVYASSCNYLRLRDVLHVFKEQIMNLSLKTVYVIFLLGLNYWSHDTWKIVFHSAKRKHYSVCL